MNDEIVHPGAMPIRGSVERSAEPGRPCVRLESGCNEIWLDKEEAESVVAYLQRAIPTLNGAPE